MSASALPPELWELICSFIPQEEVCRLRSLNRFFLSTALKIHYGTLVVEYDDPHVKSLMNRRYALDKVHTLHLKNYVKIPPFYSSKVPSSYRRWGDDYLTARASLTKRFVRYPVVKFLRRLHNVQHLRLELGRFASVAFNTIVFSNFRETLVHLDLSLMDFKHFNISWLDGAVYCPNVRSLRLCLNAVDQSISLPASFFEPTVLKIRSLVPSNIESINLAQEWWTHIAPSAISLSFFNKLKKLVCSGFPYPPNFPFDIVELVNTNRETLLDIQINIGAYLMYEELNWDEQVHTLSLYAMRFYLTRDLCLPRLAKCYQLRTLRLNGMIRGHLDTDHVNLDKEQYEEFHQSVFMALSGTVLSLVHLEIPYLTISFQKIWDIVYTFPNLDTLILIGAPDTEDMQTNHLLLKVRYFAIVRPSGVGFLDLKSRLCDIRKSVNGCSSSDFWQEHSESIEEALASCCPTPPYRYDSY